MRTIEQRIYDIIAKVTDKPSQPVTPLMELGVDSLDMMLMELGLEKEFNIRFPDEWYEGKRIVNTMTPHDVVCMVEYEYLNVKPEVI